MDKGKVKNFNDDRGFGFITDEESGQNFFFHISNITSEDTIKENDVVEFEVIEGKKGLMAVNITIIK